MGAVLLGSLDKEPNLLNKREPSPTFIGAPWRGAELAIPRGSSSPLPSLNVFGTQQHLELVRGMNRSQ